MATTDSIATPDGVIGASSLFELKLSREPKPNEKPKCYVRLLFTAEAMQTAEFTALKSLVVATAKAKWPGVAEAMLQEKSIRLPFRTDIAAKGYLPEFKCFLTLSATRLPGIVSRYNDPATGKPRIITDPREIWSGCIGRATVGAYAYGGPGTTFSPGVGLGLRNFMLRNIAGVKYERLNGGNSADDDFGAGETAPEGAMGSFAPPTSSGNSKDDLNDLLG